MTTKTPALAHDKPADPFSRIPAPDAQYADTVFETSAEREQRAACPEPDRDEEADR